MTVLREPQAKTPEGRSAVLRDIRDLLEDAVFAGIKAARSPDPEKTPSAADAAWLICRVPAACRIRGTSSRSSRCRSRRPILATHAHNQAASARWAGVMATIPPGAAM